jgi:hypothetical protein
LERARRDALSKQRQNNRKTVDLFRCGNCLEFHTQFDSESPKRRSLIFDSESPKQRRFATGAQAQGSLIFDSKCPMCGHKLWEAVRFYMCDSCKKNTQGKEGRMNCCSGCRVASYCSVECQHQHWAQHKIMCKDMSENVRYRYYVYK